MEKRETTIVEINLRELIRFYWQKKFIVILITFLFGIGSITYSLLTTEWFSASVSILPSSNSGLSGSLMQFQNLASMIGVNLGNLGENDQILYPEIIRSNFVIDKLIHKKFYSRVHKDSISIFELIDVDVDTTEENWQYVKLVKTMEEVRENYIFSELDDETGILTIGIEVPEDPVLASEAANYLVELLDSFNKKLRYNKAREERKFIEKTIDSLKTKLSLIEKKLIDFETKHLNDNAPKLRLIHDRLKRELDLHNLLYSEIKKQLELTKIEEIRQTRTFDILNYATVPILKSRPQRTIIVLMSTFLGFFLSIILVLILFMYKKLIHEFE